uniref:C2H2-type domain-containing protein n=1 Tax=Heterorhabditis bacteriophora TaxID=37862 RepID=A0A1I7W7Q6_HETBA
MYERTTSASFLLGFCILLIYNNAPRNSSHHHFMSASDFLVQRLLSKTPSPALSCTSGSSEEHLDINSAESSSLFKPELLTYIQPELIKPEPVKPLDYVRRTEEDTVTLSPVSGMFIKEEFDVPSPEELQKEVDNLDETAAYVEVSEESRKKIDQIPNIIGDSMCCLCKVFSCPANLASHRRWHKPRDQYEKIQCPSCVHVFHNRKQYKNHLAGCSSVIPITDVFPTLMPVSMKLEIR